MGEKGKHEHLLPSSRYAATRAQLRAHRSLHSNLLPGKKKGATPLPIPGLGIPVQHRQGERWPQRGHVCHPAPRLPPGAMPAPSRLASARREHPARPGVPLPPHSSVTHPLQGEINTSAHIRRSTEKSFSWEWGRGGCFSHASSMRLALRSLPLSWVWEMALASRPAAWW